MRNYILGKAIDALAHWKLNIWTA